MLAKPTRQRLTLYTCLQKPSACTVGRSREQRVGDGAGEGRRQGNTLNILCSRQDLHYFVGFWTGGLTTRRCQEFLRVRHSRQPMRDLSSQ